MNFSRFLVLLLLLTTASSCEEDSIACTMEFRMVTVMVTGPALTSYYTFRPATGDTIRISQENVGGQAGVYPISDDSYQMILEVRTENFIFRGFINDSLVVNESYGISADECHISYVSGNLNVTL